jgi:four helix bundle protein
LEKFQVPSSEFRVEEVEEVEEERKERVTFTTFEDIDAWKKGRPLVNEIYKITGESPFDRDFALKDQMRRAGISVVSNIAEGFERDGNKEFIQYLSISKGSVGEVRSQLYLALDLQYVAGEEFNRIKNLTEETGKMIAGLINYLKKTNMKGKKYRS